MEATVLAHGGAAGGIAEAALVVVPLIVMGIISLLRKRKTQKAKDKGQGRGEQ
ncbi:MAG TPA: hypothetical protein VNA87_05185 [Actinomycetota bacterium]|nr:hypothetical protein [Actinomycetota bacterium]